MTPCKNCPNRGITAVNLREGDFPRGIQLELGEPRANSGVIMIGSNPGTAASWEKRAYAEALADRQSIEATDTHAGYALPPIRIRIT